MRKITEIKFHKTRKDYYLYLDRKYHYLGKTLEEAERNRRKLIADAFSEETELQGNTVADLYAKFLESHQILRSFINCRSVCRYSRLSFNLSFAF